MTKYVCITGGVVSSLGKGITAASLGRLLKARGYRVSICKLDPYLNVDPGTMNPYQHGEVYVTADGGKRIWMWAITSGLSTRPCPRTTTPPPARSICGYWTGNGRGITMGALCRLSPISPMRS